MYDIEDLKLLRKIKEIVVEYYNRNDNAHQLDHALEVLANLTYINKLIGYTNNIPLLIITALYHDIFSNRTDRANHHNLAADYVLKDKFINSILSKDDVLLASIAIREHRASFKGTRSNRFSDMLSTADIGKPNLKAMVERSMKYSNNIEEDVVNHMKDKFGYGGYANYPELYLIIYEKELLSVKDNIDKLFNNEITIKEILGD